MKKSIFLIAFALVSFAFTANAQCCSSKGKKKGSCSKMSSTTSKSIITDEKDASISATNPAPIATEANYKTETFTVYGNCGMCEKTIEGSLKGVNGINLGDWNKETDIMTVSYDPTAITLDEIKQKIADVGYDSDTHRAKEEVYNELPGCCQYDRPAPIKQ